MIILTYLFRVDICEYSEEFSVVKMRNCIGLDGINQEQGKDHRDDPSLQHSVGH